jgi:hypothetical protein
MRLSRRLFVLDGKMVDFDEHCRVILSLFLTRNGMDDVSSSWKWTSGFGMKKTSLFL